LGERIAAIQEVCGLKRPQKASHILRATFVSTAHAKGIDRERYKDYIGHASTKESGRTQMTDDYITNLISLIRKEDRHIIDFIPTREEVQRLVTEFEPTTSPARGAGAQ
jgi:hypothetical protein